MFIEARTRAQESIDNNYNEGLQKNQDFFGLFNEVSMKEQLMTIYFWICYPQRKSLMNWLLKAIGLMFIITMASKIYLLNYLPELQIIENVVPQVVITKRWSDIGKENNTKNQKIWRQAIHEQYYKCSQRKKKEIRTYNATNGYIVVTANGGLNQMRVGISDMVAIAHLMNATLVQPKLDHNSYWKDKSEFVDIFDWEQFVEVLKNDITIVKFIPHEFQRRKFLVKAPISWSKANYYKWEMSRLLKKYKVVHFTQTNSRLANNGLSGSIQRLRCRAMFEALQYTKEIKTLANNFINNLRRNNNPYIALHLRYEKDMLAFTACTHNLTSHEEQELTKMRRKTRHWKEKHINSKHMRLQGACPMTPREVAIFLEALGFPNDTTIYIAAGEIFGHVGLKPLRDKFPNIYDHSSLAIEEEVASFKDHSNKLAAVDYLVAVQSDVFVYTYNGHMAKAVKGHRLYEGFRKTISPDIKNYVRLIDMLDNKQISWEEFSVKIKELHKGRTGVPSYRNVGPNPVLEDSFYENPYPGCICKTP